VKNRRSPINFTEFPRFLEIVNTIWALPLDLCEIIGADALIGSAEAGYISDQLVRAGVRRDVAEHWPQRIGYNVTLRLAERGRIAFALLSCKRDIFRATRKRPGEFSEHFVRVELTELLAALRAAGQRRAKGRQE
jgi:hypothetical protein